LEKFKYYILFVLIIYTISSCDSINKKKPEINEGKIDLQTWNFNQDGNVSLNGKWEFYWKQLLEPKDFENPKSKLKPAFIHVPKSWAAKQKNDKVFPKFGYGTYRLKILLPKEKNDYKFMFSSIFSSTKVWINGEFCFENGIVGTSKQTSKPKYLINYILESNTINNTSDSIEIIIQTSDFYKGGNYGGIKRKITLGTDVQIYESESLERALTWSLIAVLTLIAVYHLFLYAYRPTEYSYLVFSLISLVSASRAFFNLGTFSHYVSYDFFGRFGFMPVALYPFLLILFFHFLYKKEIKRRVVYFFLIIALTFSPFIFVGGPEIVPKLEPFLILYVLSVLPYLLGFALLKALIRRRQGAVYAFLGTFILLLSNIHDAVFSQGLIYGFGFFVSEVGFGIYIVLQSLNLAEIFSISLKKNLKLNRLLDHQNKNLELIVQERTREIEDKSKEILLQNEILNNKNEEIRAQSEEIEIQRDLAHDQNKQIISSINYAKRIQNAVLPSAEFASEVLSDYFIFHKPRNIVSGDFYWIKKIENKLFVAVADCTGHGVPGAFMSMLGFSYLNDITTVDKNLSSGEILNLLRLKIKESLKQKGERGEQKDGMDIALYIIDNENLKLQFSGANNPLYIIRESNSISEEIKQANPKLARIFNDPKNSQKSIIELRPDKQPIAIYIKETIFKSHNFKLQKDDCLYTFSDGYADQFGGKFGRKFNISHLRSLLLNISDKPMNEQVGILDIEFETWRGFNEQVDDVLVMGVRI